jgi:hypothetical protein
MPFASLLILAAVAAAAPAVVAQPSALPADWQFVLNALPTDPPAEKLLGIEEKFVGRHYLTGDEWNGHLWLPHIAHKGGLYVGVGSDQAYLHAAWVKPDLAVFIDYDPWVVDLHAVYQALIADAATPAEFLALWQPGRANQAVDRIQHQYAGHAKLNWYVTLYRRNRGNIAYRLALLKKHHQELKVASWLTDDASYAWLRQLVQAGRVRVLQCDLLGQKGMQGLGEAARKLGLSVSVLYLSNAEEYWPYGKEFRENVRALPMDAGSVVIRTLSSFSVNKDYRYNVQPGLLFQAWMERKWMAKVWQLVKKRKLAGPDDFDLSVTDRDPVAEEAKKKAKGKKK